MSMLRRLAVLGAATALAMVGLAGTSSAGTTGPALTVDPGVVTPGQVFTVSGNGCASTADNPAEVQVAFEGDVTTVVPSAAGTWSIKLTASGSGVEPVAVTCDQYSGSYRYPAASVKVEAQGGSIGDITRAGCKVDIPVTVQGPGKYAIQIWDDGAIIDTLPFTAAADSTNTVVWTITRPAGEEAPGVAVVLVDASGTELQTIDPYEYPASAADACSVAGTMTIAIAADNGPIYPGGPVALTAGGFYPGEQVTAVLHSAPIVLSTLVADDSGLVSATVTIPAATELGAHTITLTGETSDLAASIGIVVVQAPVAPPAEPSGPVLAATGVDATGMSFWGVGLLLAGAAALALARRRSRV